MTNELNAVGNIIDEQGQQFQCVSVCVNYTAKLIPISCVPPKPEYTPQSLTDNLKEKAAELLP